MGDFEKKRVMRLGLALICGIQGNPQPKKYNPGINLVDCSEHFREGAEWPLEDVADAGTTVRICQNNDGDSKYFYTTLFSVTDRLPVWSGGKFIRYSNKPTYSRPNSNWHYLLNALCLDDDDYLPEQDSFYGNLGSVGSSNYDFCAKHQALDTDYKGNTGDLGIDRGHLVPNGIMNQDPDAQKATFTLTNIAAQYSAFNQKAWNQLECMVRHYMDNDIADEYAWIFTGTYGTGLIMNEDNPDKNNVRLPAYYWKSFCYVGDDAAYSWVYMQENDPSQSQSSGGNFMSVNRFVDEYYDGEPLYDDACQNPSNGFGPWFSIINDWDEYKKRYGC